MDSIVIRQGARLDFDVIQADPDSLSATFLAVLQDGDTQIYAQQPYADGVAHFTIDNTNVVGIYDYQVMENFAEGNPDIYPNMDNCDGDCDFPTLEICEALIAEG